MPDSRVVYVELPGDDYAATLDYLYGRPVLSYERDQFRQEMPDLREAGLLEDAVYVTAEEKHKPVFQGLRLREVDREEVSFPRREEGFKEVPRDTYMSAGFALRAGADLRARLRSSPSDGRTLLFALRWPRDLRELRATHRLHSIGARSSGLPAAFVLRRILRPPVGTRSPRELFLCYGPSSQPRRAREAGTWLALRSLALGLCSAEACERVLRQLVPRGVSRGASRRCSGRPVWGGTRFQS